MKFPIRLLTAGAAALAAGAFVASPASALEPSAAHVVLVSTDDPTGNHVAVYDRADNGSLTFASEYATGGNGGQLDGSVVDHTASQGALAYDAAHGLVLVTNAGSDTISVFAIHGDQLRRVQILSSGGSFPVSITVQGNLVYVLNARGGASIQGYVIAYDRLIRVPAWNRALNLPTAAPEFTHTPGQVALTPDGRALLVTTKAATSSIDVFAISHGAPSASPVVTADPGAVPFAIAWDRGGHAVIAEAGTNSVASYGVRHNGQLVLVSRVATGQAATCWIAGWGSDFYASNAGSANVSIVRDHGSGALTAQGTNSTSPGTVDAAISPDGQFLYVQGGANGTVDAFRIKGDGSLAARGTVTVPNALGAEGIAAT
jgi:DNA-binding beta-propeller fold protein YncE